MSFLKLTLLFCISAITLVFLFNPHYIELSVLENWFFIKGLVWYKEFPAEHFPLGRLVLLPTQLLSNWSFKLDPFVALLTGSLSLLLIYRFGKKYLTHYGTTVSLLFFTIFFWYFTTGVQFFHEILIGLLLLSSTYLLFNMYMEKKLSQKKLLISGILLSATELSGQIATLSIATLASLLLYLIKSRSKSQKKFLKSITIVLLGTVIPLFPFLVYFTANNALIDFFYWNVPYYLTYASDASKNLSILPYKIILTFYLPLITLLVLTLMKRNRNIKNVSMLLLSMSTIPSVVFSIFHFHHFNYALPILALTAGMTFSQTPGYKLLKRVLKTTLLGALLLVFANVILPWHRSRIIFPPSLRIYNLETTPGDNTHETIEWLKKNTSPSSRIMVLGTSIVYLRSDRLPASRPAKGIPYTWTPMESVKQEMIAAPPDYWIVDRRFLNRIVISNRREDIKNFIDEELARCFSKVVQYDNWEIWQKMCR